MFYKNTKDATKVIVNHFSEFATMPIDSDSSVAVENKIQSIIDEMNNTKEVVGMTFYGITTIEGVGHPVYVEFKNTYDGSVCMNISKI